jgi:hypothetical protein
LNLFDALLISAGVTMNLKEMFNARDSALAAWRANSRYHPARFVVALNNVRDIFG